LEGEAPPEEEGCGSDTRDLETGVGTDGEAENDTGTMSLETRVRPCYRESVIKQVFTDIFLFFARPAPG
jgi:hypothetical protein